MKKIRSEKGQSLLEFALILPLLILFLIAFFDLGRAVLAYSTLNTAVREGTRYAVVQPKGGADGVIIAKVRSYYFNINDINDNSSITIDRAVGTTTDPKIKISISYIFKPITPLVPLININVQSEMFLVPYVK